MSSSSPTALPAVPVSFEHSFKLTFTNRQPPADLRPSQSTSAPHSAKIIMDKHIIHVALYPLQDASRLKGRTQHTSN
ncbi:hypothetical protein RRG08_061122 [Elysia crispata]|uniref:Uncharacterized protein n=1 Tax=Elysia crispata TaxID=231223 RepID=A0AAE0XDR5_9GAST|nr:hypothetical protein RRG08_061122 [Elysia crispata]